MDWEDIERCVNCWNCIKWDYDDEYCCECLKRFYIKEE